MPEVDRSSRGYRRFLREAAEDYSRTNKRKVTKAAREVLFQQARPHLQDYKRFPKVDDASLRKVLRRIFDASDDVAGPTRKPIRSDDLRSALENFSCPDELWHC